VTAFSDDGSGGVRAAPDWVQAPIGRVAAPLRDQVFTAVRQAILEFKLRPGQRLIERELIEQLGVSRATVREVIARLDQEGLVKTLPQRGAIVAVISAEEATDLYQIRTPLEVMLIEHFVERADESQVKALRVAFTAIEKVKIKDGNALERLRVGDLYYQVLFDGAHSPTLVQILSILQGRVRTVRAASLATPGRLEASTNEIRAVVEAIEAHDAARAVKAATKHVQASAVIALRRIAEIETADN
jgi:DNA-binding GntR family transcriptional regulator